MCIVCVRRRRSENFVEPVTWQIVRRCIRSPLSQKTPWPCRRNGSLLLLKRKKRRLPGVHKFSGADVKVRSKRALNILFFFVTWNMRALYRPWRHETTTSLPPSVHFVERERTAERKRTRSLVHYMHGVQGAEERRHWTKRGQEKRVTTEPRLFSKQRPQPILLLCHAVLWNVTI